MTAETSPWVLLLAFLGTLGGVATLTGVVLNYLRERRLAPAQHRLITVQADLDVAARTKAEAEGQLTAFSLLSKALADASSTIDRRQRERDEALSREKILWAELEREVAWRKFNCWPAPPTPRASPEEKK